MIDHALKKELKLSEDEVRRCIGVLQELVADSAQLAQLSHEDKLALLKAAGALSRPDKLEIRKRQADVKARKKQARVEPERRSRARTGIRAAREAAVFVAPKILPDPAGAPGRAPGRLKSPRNCYICKAEYVDLHHFYDALCPPCAALNYQKRFQTADLTGQVALITGSRLKIGYQATLMLLRAGARVIATTRFPVDSALRYAKEEDFAQWKDRLHIYGLDLRHIPRVELFCQYVEQKYRRLDLLINNAAQTVRRPPGFYAHLMPMERKTPAELPEGARGLLPAAPLPFDSARLSMIPYAYDHALSAAEVFPEGKLDADLQQVDLRTVNSWRLKIGEVPTAELLEVQLVNAIAPFVLCNRLIPLMKKDRTGMKHVVNVTAMEGKFYRFKKAARHPHTNMAKAALNMLTHTAAGDLAECGIFMNAVDTGWVTDEDPAALSRKKQEEHDFQPPLDIVDGAARVCDPIFDGINTGRHWAGKFLKDYVPIDW